MNHLSEIINSRGDKQKAIRALQERRNISYWCVRSRISQRDLQITAGREKKHTHKDRKRNAKEPQTHRHGGGSVFMTPRSHLDDVYTHTQHVEMWAHATDHTLLRRSV